LKARGVKLAVTVFEVVMLSVQDPVPGHSPETPVSQPVNRQYAEAGVAVSTVVDPTANVAEQVL
jgi:hypothetical protein